MNQNEINLEKHGFYQPKPANTFPWFDSNDNINKGLSKDELNSRSSHQGSNTALADITNKVYNTIAAAASSQSSMGNIINDNDILNDVSCNRVSPRKKTQNQDSLGSNLKNVKIISEEQKDGAFEEPVKELYERITSGCSKFEKIQMMRGQEERIKIPEEKEYPGKKESYWAYGDYKRMRKLGKGAHGSVVEIRNDYGDIKVIKIFKKALQKKFLREVSILSMLRHNWDRGYVGVWDILQAKDVYGVVLSSGVGTLNDFKCFLKEEDKELTEKELISVFIALYNNYLTIRRAGLCHRDIKPANIILHKDGLAIEIIDFSLSVYTEPEGCFLGWAGTRGYIDPCIFNSTEEYGREKLIRGDFFAIGITLLELTVPNFEPKQNDMDRVRNAISGIFQKKSIIAEIIDALIFHDESKLEVLDKYSVPNRGIEIGNSGFISGLQYYYDDFLRYLARKLPTQADSLETIQLNNNGQINSTQLKIFAENCFSANSRRKEQFNKDILASNMKLAALCFLESDQEDKASLCYELIIDVFLTNQALTEGDNLEEKLNEILQYEKFIRNSLIYSRLGIYFYKHSQIERAKICFLKGLERPQDKLTRVLLLNNYGYICSIVDQDLKSNALHDAFNIIKEIIYKDSDWTTIADNLLNHDYCKKFEVKFIDLKQPSDRKEPILSIKDISWRYSFAEKLALIVFLNFCYAKANFLADVLKRKNQESLLEKFHNFSQGFYERANSITKLKPQFELLVDLFRFQKIVLDNTESLLSIEPEGVKLIEESRVIEEQKKDIYALFEQGAIKIIMECELFSTMLGFAVKFKPQDTTKDSLSKDIIIDKLSVMEEVVKTVELFIEDPFCWEEMTNIINDLQEDLNFDLNFDMNLEINESELTPPDSLCQHIERYGYTVTLDGAKQCWSLSYLHLITEEVLAYQWSDLMESLDFSPLKDIREVYWEIHSQGFLCLKKLLSDTSLLKLNLKINNASYKDLNDYDMEVLAESISQCKKSLNSFEIEISISYITDGGIEFLWQAIENLEALKDLSLTFQLCPNITDNSLLTLEKAIRKLAHLSNFTLGFYSCCEISFQVIEKFQLRIQDLVQIKQSNISIVPLLSTE